MDRRGIPADVLRRCSRSACSLLVSPGAAGTAPGLAPEDAGCGYEAGVPGTSSPHLGLLLEARPGAESPPLPPCAPQGEPPGRPEDPRQRARLPGAQVRELIHSELPRDAHDQKQVGAWGMLSRGAWVWRAHSFSPTVWAPGCPGTWTRPPQGSRGPGHSPGSSSDTHPLSTLCTPRSARRQSAAPASWS